MSNEENFDQLDIDEIMSTLKDRWMFRRKEIENFNENYIPTTIDQSLRLFNNLLFTRCNSLQRSLCKISRINGSIKNFTINEELNEKYNLPIGSYTCTINTSQINYFNKTDNDKLYYKSYNISEVHTMINHFKLKMIFFLGDYLFTGIRIVPHLSETLLIIEPNNVTGLPSTYIQSLLSAQFDTVWTLIFMPIGNFIDTYTQKSLFLSNDPANFNFNIFNKAGYNKINRKNSWMVGVTENSDRLNLMNMTYGNITTNGSNTYLTTNSTFGNRIKNNSNLSLLKSLAFNNTNIYKIYDIGPDCTFSIPLEDGTFGKHNPIPPENILVFERSSASTGGVLKYKHGLKLKLYFPNVYKIQDVNGGLYNFNSINGSNLCVMVYYSLEAENTTRFINPIKEYMEYNDEYVKDVINNELPPVLGKYIPHVNSYSIKDYEDVDMFPYSSMYKLTRLIYILNNNPKHFEEVYKKLFSINNKMLNRWVRRVSEMPTLLDRIRYTNKTEISDTKLHTSFNTAHIFFKITHTDNYLYPVNVWIDGKHINTPYRYMDRLIEYLYVPSDNITSNSVIEIEYMTMDPTNKKEATLIFESVGEYKNFPVIFKNISAATTMFYDKHTLEILDPNNFFINLKSEIEKSIIGANAGLAIASSDGNVISSGYVERDIYGWHKKIDPENLVIGINNDTYLNRQIIVSNTDNYGVVKQIVTPELYPNQNLFGSEIFVTFQNFNNDVNHNRFRVLVNGKLCPISTDRSSKVTEFPYYIYNPPSITNTTLNFNIRGVTEYSTEIIVEYLPYATKCISNFTMPRYTLTSKDINRTIVWSNHAKRPFNFDYFDIYINGYKLNKYDILQISENNILITKTSLLSSQSNNIVKIYSKTHDFDIYGNEYDNRSLNDILISEDPDFYDYLYEKNMSSIN